MLLDQKRTRRMVQVVSVIAAIAFLGAGIVVLGLAFSQGCSGSNSPQAQAIKDGEQLTKDRPQDPQAWLTLAAAYKNDNRVADAVRAARRAVALTPKDIGATSTLVVFLQEDGQSAAALQQAQRFTRLNPRNPEGFLLLAQVARAQSQATLERLALSTYLQLDATSAQADAVRERLNELTGTGTTTTTTGTTTATTPRTTTTAPATTTGPATPATP